MKEIDSPESLAKRLTELFPAFSSEIEGDTSDTYHGVLLLLTPVITGYLENSSERTIRKFCELVNYMAEAGGEKGNAIATCLLEHASQVKLRSIIRPHLGAVARRELR